MLIEIHMLQNHAPSNLNRDDTGSPKDCVFGGVRRARISSQCLKRSIRLSALFRAGLEGTGMAMRTRKLPEEVQTLLLKRGLSPEMAKIAAAKASGIGTKDGEEQDQPRTAQVMFLTPADIEAVAYVLEAAATTAVTPVVFEKVSAAELQKAAALRGWRPITPDLALFGRMITSDAFRDVSSAVQVAHAISTHKMEHEFDYFTAVDDLLGQGEDEDEQGAGMISDVEFNSACYYKYFSLDLAALAANLAGPTPVEAQRLAEARRVARQTVLAFVNAAAFTTPTGKQNTFAAHQLPDAVLVEVREPKIPVSYANAFVKPVAARGGNDLVGASIAQFKEHVERLNRKFSLPSRKRLWFTTGSEEIVHTTTCDTFDDLIAALGDVMESWAADG